MTIISGKTDPVVRSIAFGDVAEALILGLKIVFFGVAVALVPMAAVLGDTPSRRRRASTELQGLVRMFTLILLIEAASLVGNYY